MSDADSSQPDTVLNELSSRLSSNGWKVRIQAERDTTFTVEVSHQLTTPYLLTFRRDRPSHLGLIQYVMSLPEIVLIAEAPTDVKHAGLLQSMRGAAKAHGWSDGELSIIARVLFANDVLTEAEADWLERAGVPWTEDERTTQAG